MKHQWLLFIYINRGNKTPFVTEAVDEDFWNVAQEIWQSPDTMITHIDFEMASHLRMKRQMRLHWPIPYDWECLYQEGDRVELLMPEPDHEIPVWLGDIRSTGSIAKIEEPNSHKAAARLPCLVNFHIKHLSHPDKLETVSVYVHPDWIGKCPAS